MWVELKWWSENIVLNCSKFCAHYLKWSEMKFNVKFVNSGKWSETKIIQKSEFELLQFHFNLTLILILYTLSEVK